MAYPLPATCFSRMDSTVLQRSINLSVLGKMGIVRSASTILANTPTHLGGYGILDINIEQMVQHIGMLSLHMHQPSIIGMMITISLEQYILESGRGGSPFDTTMQSMNT